MVENNPRCRPAEGDLTLWTIIEDVARRRDLGEEIADESITQAHPELMPELGEKLAALRFAETTRKMAAEGSRSDAPDNIRGVWPPDSRPAPGRLEQDMFRGYQLGEITGRGATGIVYRATHLATGREVAIKVMIHAPFEGDADEARFEREARILAQLKHPNIVTIYDSGWSNGRFFLVMDFVAGEPLDVWMRRRSLSLDEKIRIFAEIAESVHAAHLRGVIHRDLKPSNIRIDEAGCPHLLDFGLAKVLATNGENGEVPPAYVQSMTMTGQFVGSLPWASPEQAEGAPDKVDIRTDVYSLGVIFYQAVAARFPYPVMGNIRDVIDRILTARPPRMRDLCPQIDDDLDTIVATCLSKERERRYQSAGELAQDLRRRLAGEPIAAKGDSSWYVLRKTLARHRLVATATAAVALLTIAYAVTVSYLYGRAQADARRAQRTLSFLQNTLFQASSHGMGSGATLAEVLDLAAKRIPEEFKDQPEIEAALQFTVGSAYESTWRKTKGVEHLQRALTLNRQVYGARHQETHRNMVLLGMVMAEIGDEESIPLLRDALQISKELYGGKHPMVAESMAELAFALWAAGQPGKWDEAAELYDQSIALFHETAGAQHPDLARALVGQASMNKARGEYALAEARYRESCAMSQKILGEAHQFTIECKMGLAELLADVGRHEEAQLLMNDVQLRAERQFGPANIPTLMRRTAWLQMDRSDFEGAERTLFDAQSAQCRRLGVIHPEQHERLQSLAEALQQKVGRRGADTVYMDALEATQEFDPDPLEAARILIALGQLRQRQERYVYAEKLLQRCLEFIEHTPTPEFSLRTRAARMLATCLQMSGKAQEAESLLQTTFEWLRHALGHDAPLTVTVAGDLLTIYQRSGQTSKAEEMRSFVK